MFSALLSVNKSVAALLCAAFGVHRPIDNPSLVWDLETAIICIFAKLPEQEGGNEIASGLIANKAEMSYAILGVFLWAVVMGPHSDPGGVWSIGPSFEHGA